MFSVIIYREMNVTCYFHHSNVNSGLNTKMKSFQTLFWSTQVIFCSLPLPFVPSLFFFLFLISFISIMHKHTHVNALPCRHIDSVMSDSSTPWTVACQMLLSIEFSRQEYWNGLPGSSPYVLTNSFQERSLMYTFYLNARIA